MRLRAVPRVRAAQPRPRGGLPQRGTASQPLRRSRHRWLRHAHHRRDPEDFQARRRAADRRGAAQPGPACRGLAQKGCRRGRAQKAGSAAQGVAAVGRAVKAGVADAEANAAANGLADRFEVHCGRVEDWLPELLAFEERMPPQSRELLRAAVASASPTFRHPSRRRCGAAVRGRTPCQSAGFAGS